MRTTLTIDDDVLAAARELAHRRDVAIGTVLSELARAGLEAGRRATAKVGRVPTFAPRPGAPAITSEAVRAALDDE